jgi:hypothetical protein
VEHSIRDIQPLKHLLTEIITEDGRGVLDADISIERFGNSTMEKYHSDTLFITKTGIHPTMTLAISSLWSNPSIQNIIGTVLLRNKSSLLSILQKETGIEQRVGTDRLKAGRGIKSMVRTLVSFLLGKFAASSARNLIKPESFHAPDFVRISVGRSGEEMFVLMMRQEAVLSALKSLEQIDMPKQHSAQKFARVREIGRRAVYNLTIQEKHEFYANGILVSNCLDALRYALYTHFFGKDTQRYTAEELDNLYRESRGGQANLPPFFQQPGY